jgi:hypothetical protein
VTRCLICPEDAGHRYACHKCVNRMRRQLRELDDYAVIMAATLGPLRGGPSRRSPGYGSRSPARIEVLVMLDHRSRTDQRSPDDEETPTWSILGTLAGLAEYIRGHFGEPEPRAITITGTVAYLLSRVDKCAMERWVPEIAADITDLHTQVRAAAHDQPPGPIGGCLTVTCDGHVHWLYNHQQPDQVDARCSACRRPYTGLDLARLATQEAS